MDTQAAVADPRSMSPPTNSDLSSGGSPPMAHVAAPLQPTTPGQIGDDEIIPTAIVIKNIPFNVKRETLLDIIVSPFHFVSMALTLFSCCRVLHRLIVYVRPPCLSQHHTPSTITWIPKARSAVWHLQTSARLRMLTRSWSL